MESVSVSFQVHIGHQWARCMDDEIIQRYTDTVVGSAKENAGDGRRKALSRQAVATSGGHGARTRNPLRGTTFPVWPLTIRLPSERRWLDGSNSGWMRSGRVGFILQFATAMGRLRVAFGANSRAMPVAS